MGSASIKILWFIFGLGSQLQVLGSLSITEAIVLVFTPFLIVSEYRQMKRDGVALFYWLSVILNCGCVVSCLANKTELAFALRGLAATGLITCSIVVGHWLLRKDLMGFRWMIIGMFISGFLCLFVFKKEVEVTMLGESAEAIMSGPLFWISRLKPLVLLPITGWYLQTPTAYGVVMPVAFAIFTLFTSTSGRSSVLSLLAITFLVAIGRKHIRTMSLVSRHFWLFGFLGLIGVLMINSLYGYAARNYVFGSEFTEKYEHQTQLGKNVVSLVVAGRAEAFVGLWACVDKPILGWGPWAMDERGYYENFLERYGSYEDYVTYIKTRRNNLLRSVRELPSIPAHSHVTQFWLWFGIPGLVFILYVIFVILRFVKQDVSAVPQWYGWLLCGVPGMLWSILFSALIHRFILPLFVVGCLMARAVRKGAFKLPMSMVDEIGRLRR